jgi:hypothetical protein
MKERIKELALEAMTYVTHNPKANKLNSGDMFDEKFAELIVQECIDIIAPYTVRMSRPGEEYLHPILEIRQHFGVEE